MRIDVIGGRRRLVTGAMIAGAVIPAALASSAAGAGAATVSVDKACYVIEKALPPMTITGSGFVPGDEVEISDSLGGLSTSTTADPDGNIDLPTSAPGQQFFKPGTRTDTITATDDTAGGPTITASTTTLLAPLLAATGKTRKATGLKAFTLKTKWSFSGFPEGATIYGHYRFKHKVVANQKFGKAVGPCGTLIVSKKVYPAKPKHRSYKLQIDTAKKYSKLASPKIDSKLSLSLF